MKEILDSGTLGEIRRSSWIITNWYRPQAMIADGREGLNALLISNAMHLSAWTGREVELPFDESLFKSLLDERIKTSRKKESTAYIFSEFNKTHKGIL